MHLLLSLLLLSYLPGSVDHKEYRGTQLKAHTKALKPLKGDLGVVGIRLGTGHRINLVRPHTPASEAGILKGDIILQVDSGWNYDAIDGAPNTPVLLFIIRGKELKEFKVTRRALRSMPWLPASLYHYPKQEKLKPVAPSSEDYLIEAVLDS